MGGGVEATMSVLTEHDRHVVALAIAKARAPRAKLMTRTQALAPRPRVKREKAEPLLFMGLCGWCGAPALLGQAACEGHSDLEEIDGRTSAVVTTATSNGPARSTFPGSASGATGGTS